MIVDDEDRLREMVGMILSREGYQVSEAANGLECLERVRAGFHGLIFMDVNMPVLDGWQALQRLREERLLTSCLVCMLTGAEDRTRDQALKDSVFDYLSKPFSRAHLLAVADTARVCLVS